MGSVREIQYIEMDSTSGSEKQILPFSQEDFGTQRGSAACCPISLMLCLYVNAESRYSNADTLFQDIATIRKAVRYGNLLWQIAVVAERSASIKDAMLQAVSVRSRQYIVQPDMDDYLLPTIDELFLRCLSSVCAANPREREPNLADIGVQIQIPNTISHHQSVCSLVHHSFILGDILGVDEYEDVAEFALDSGFVAFKQRYRLIQNLLSNHASSRASLARMESYLSEWTRSFRMPKRVDMEKDLYKNSSPEFWYLYCCTLENLNRYEYHVCGSTDEEFHTHIIKPALECSPFLKMMCRDSENRDLADALDYLVPIEDESWILPAPTQEQLIPKVYSILIRMRCAKSIRLMRRRNGQVDPIHILDAISIPGSYVVTGMSERSISIHTFATDFVNGMEYVVYDSHSHMGGNGGSTLYLCKDPESLCESISGQFCGTVYKLRILPGAAHLLESKFRRIEAFLLIYQNGRFFKRPESPPPMETDGFAIDEMISYESTFEI
jgi:hypothetical protein